MFMDVFNKLLCENNKSVYRVAKETGISQGTMNEYKKGKKTPSPKNLQKIASYFNCSVDYLLGSTDEHADQQKDTKEKPQVKYDSGLREKGIYLLFSRLDDVDKAKAEAYIQGLLSADKYSSIVAKRDA